MSSEHIVIIGHGIAARCVIFELNQRGYKHITVVASEPYAPMCSTRSTAINCLRGTERGTSDLGDLILDSYRDFEMFNETHKPSGIVKTLETHCTPTNSSKLDKWNRRYSKYGQKSSFQFFKKELHEELFYIDNEAYIITPEILFEWFQERSSYNYIEDSVIKVSDNILVLANNESLAFDKLIICTSFMSQSFKELVKDEKLKHKLVHSKPVSGSYLKYSMSDFDESQLDLNSTYCFRIDEIHFIVRHLSQDVLIGATSTNNSMDDSGNVEGMKEQIDRLGKYLKGVVDLPPFEDGKLITGIRHKGQSRRPYWGEINKNVYATWGLYKNAYTFSFSMAKDLANLIQK